MRTNNNRVVATLWCVQIVALFAFCHIAQAETDPTAFINDALLKKGIRVQRTRDEPVDVRQCDWTGDTGGGGAPLEHCFTTKGTKKVPFTDDARIDAAQVVSASDVVFDTAQTKSLPDHALVQRLTYRNCGPGSLSAPISLQIVDTDGWTTQKSQTISSTTTVNVQGKFDIGIAGAQTSVTEAIGLSATTTSGESHSEQVTRGFSGQLNNLQKGDAGIMQLLVYRSTAVIPFHATVVVDGTLEGNSSGYTKASELLSVQERTIPFTGSITVDGLSDEYLDNEEAPQPMQCANSNSLVMTKQNFDYPASGLTAQFKNKFKKVDNEKPAPAPAKQAQARPRPTPGNKKLAVQNYSALSTMASGVVLDLQKLRANADAGPTIGSPDGTSYTVTSTSEVTRMDPSCGYNDSGAANGATYTVETRHYTTYANGKLVNSWDDTVETFKACSDGP